MQFEALCLGGAFRVTVERNVDHRGFFARTFCRDEFAAAGIVNEVVQCSISYSEFAGTVRGLHFQWPPSTEGKLVRCVRGAIHDVIVDLRPDSATYLHHLALRLDEDSRDAVFIPHGVAHGFQTLAPGSEVLYQMTDVYAPDLTACVRWDDAAFGIEWPRRHDVVISERDANCPVFDRAVFEAEWARRLGAR